MLIRLGSLVAAASGSVGSVTLKNTRSGPLLTARRHKSNTRSDLQINHQSLIPRANAAWRALTAVQKNAWRIFARTMPRQNRLGVTVYPTAHQLWVSYALPHYAAALTPLATPPPSLPFYGALAVILDITSAPKFEVGVGLASGSTNNYNQIAVAQNPALGSTTSFRRWHWFGTFVDNEGLLVLTAPYIERWGNPRIGQVIGVRISTFSPNNFLSPFTQVAKTITA